MLNTHVLKNGFGGMTESFVKPMMASLFCIALLAAGCKTTYSDSADLLLTPMPTSLSDEPVGNITYVPPNPKPVQLPFPKFALVAPEEIIKQSRVLKQPQIIIKDGLIVRKLELGNGDYFPVLSEKEAKQLSGDVRSSSIEGWTLCFLDRVGSGASATVSVDCADNPYLFLCKREFSLMRELCQKLGAKSVEITDSEKRYKEMIRHGEVDLEIKAQQFGGAGKAEYEETYSHYKDFFATTSAEFNGGKGADRIKRSREEYSPELKARLENKDNDFCDLELLRKNAQNQVTHWAWVYSYKEKGDKNLMARLEAGCKILGVPIGGVVSPSWQKTEKWERQKKWYLIATFPESEIID